MRIISGYLKGISFIIPNKINIRPTTDCNKESLFNILNNKVSFENLNILDLFSGSGNITYEFISRSISSKVICVDNNRKCINYINKNVKKYNLSYNIKLFKSDVFKFLKKEYNNRKYYNIIFADPPYDISKIKLHLMLELIFKFKIIHPKGLIILEHNKKNIINSDFFQRETRRYGNTCFSFFKNFYNKS